MSLPNRQSVDAKLVSGYEEGMKHGAGAFWYVEGGMMVIVPGSTWRGHGWTEADCEEKELDEPIAIIIPFNRWSWDGNREKPTLTPSILLGGTVKPEIWHGYMTAGRLVSC